MINIYISTDPYTHLAQAWTSMLQWLPLEAALEFKIQEGQYSRGRVFQISQGVYNFPWELLPGLLGGQTEW